MPSSGTLADFVRSIVTALVMLGFVTLGASGCITGSTLDPNAAVDELGPNGEAGGNNNNNSNNNSNPTGNPPGNPPPVGDPTNSGCISDRVDIPNGEHCQCTFSSCDAKALTCKCDLECFSDTDCLINSDSNGNASTDDGFLGGCQLSCTPENDLSKDVTCSANNCTPNPNTVQVSPVVAPTAPPASAAAMERAPQNVGVLFVVDNSRSMTDDQMAAACAINSFVEAASANGGISQTGVLTTDMVGKAPGSSQTYDLDGNFVGPPQLVGLDGACTTRPVCACGSTEPPTEQTCRFAEGGDFVQSNAPDAATQLQQLVVQGSVGDNREGGLEQAFQFLAAMEKNGTFATQAPKEIVVISDEEANGDGFLCSDAGSPQTVSFNDIQRNTAGIPNFNPPAPSNRPESCTQDLIAFYRYYFTSRGIIVHGINYTNDCGGNSSEQVGAIYASVIQATGGHLESICQCQDFDDFFTNVGDTTSTLSTSLCFDNVTPVPASIEVTYLEGGASTPVPQSSTDGWRYDAMLNCLVFAGSWLDKFGSYDVDYVDVNAPPAPPSTAKACLPAGEDPLLDTIELTCGSTVVPRSETDGWSFDPVTDCFTFRGSYVNVPGPCDVRYF